jgi:hypothetical protein
MEVDVTQTFHVIRRKYQNNDCNRIVGASASRKNLYTFIARPELFTSWLLAPSAMFLSQIDVTREAYLELSSQITTANMVKQENPLNFSLIRTVMLWVWDIGT